MNGGAAITAAARGQLYDLLATVFRRQLDARRLELLRAPEMLAAMSAAAIDPGQDFINGDGEAVLDRLAIDYTQLFHGPVERISPYECIQLGDSEEGMFAFRVAGTMKVNAGGTLFNANGQKNNDTWGQRAPWCDYSGPLGGKTVGIAILDHPENFRFPTYWHVRPYGLFCANRFGIHDFTRQGDGSHTISAGQSLTQRFRVLVHEGDAREARIAERFASFSEPPHVTVTRMECFDSEAARLR